MTFRRLPPTQPPTIASAVTDIDKQADMLRLVTRQRDDYRHQIGNFQTKLADVQAERDNIYPLLRDAGELNAKLTQELSLLAPFADRLMDDLAEAEIRADELADELDEMRAELTAAITELALACNERDTLRAVNFRG